LINYKKKKYIRTAAAFEEGKKKIQKNGLDTYLRKPSNECELLGAIKSSQGVDFITKF